MCCHFPFGTHFSRFSTNFLNLFFFSNEHKQTSWFQIIESIESTHTKLIGPWWKPDIHDIFLDIDSNEEIVRYLIDFDYFLWYMRLFCTCYWANPISIELLMLATQVPSPSPIFRILWTYMLLWVMSMFDIIFGCLDIDLICYDKKHDVCHIF